MGRVGRWVTRGSLAALACAAAVPAQARAQWREVPSGAVRGATPWPAARPAQTRYTDRATYGVRGMVVGTVVVLVAPLVAIANGDDCLGCEYVIFLAPVGTLLGGLAGVAVWDIRYQPRQTPQPLPALEREVERFMLVGALTGAVGGVAAAELRRCDDCSRSTALLQNVPMSAAVGAISGAVVSEVVRRRGAAGKSARGR